MATPAAHVVPKSVLQFDEEDSQVRFDDSARRLVLIKHRQFVALSLNSMLPPLVVESGGKVENVRFSLNHRFAAVQRSDAVLDFMDLQGGTSFSHSPPGTSDFQRQRVWKGQPGGGFIAEGTSPSSTMRVFWTRVSAMGTAERSASV